MLLIIFIVFPYFYCFSFPREAHILYINYFIYFISCPVFSRWEEAFGEGLLLLWLPSCPAFLVEVRLYVGHVLLLSAAARLIIMLEELPPVA